jgi:hypothetical protein
MTGQLPKIGAVKSVNCAGVGIAEMKHRIVHALQKYELNPPIKLSSWSWARHGRDREAAFAAPTAAMAGSADEMFTLHSKRARSLRIAVVVLAVIIVIFFAAAFIFLFIFFIVRLLSKTGIG